MARLKEFLAFPLYASAIWLLWVLSIQVGESGILIIGAGAVLLVFSIWLLNHLPKAGVAKVICQLLALVMLAAVLYSPSQLKAVRTVATTEAVSLEANGIYESYSADRLAAYRSEGPVFVNFTAAWCVTCKVNEAVALSTEATMAMFTEKQVLYLKGDWTNEDPEITRKLAEHGRSGVPLYLLYHPGEDVPVVLPQILTQELVLAELRKL